MSVTVAAAMDRFQLARHFAFIKAKDEINSLTDPSELKEVAIGMLKMNMGLREYIHRMAREEIEASQHMPPKKA